VGGRKSTRGESEVPQHPWAMSSCSTSSEEEGGGKREEEHEGRERGAAELRRCIDAVRLHPHRGGGGREEEPRGAHGG
jgi:hypothetical protein